MADNSNQNRSNNNNTSSPKNNNGGSSNSANTKGGSYIHMPISSTYSNGITPVGANNGNPNTYGQGNISKPEDSVVIKAGIEKTAFPECALYVIADYDGEDASLNIVQNKNKCKCADHDYMEVEHTDKDSGKMVKEKMLIKGNSFKIYYYDLNKRSQMIGLAAGVSVIALDPIAAPLSTPISSTAGVLAGGIVDFCLAFRFFKLPELTPSDTDFVYFTKINLHSCPNNPAPPEILIVSYPDISFCIEFGFSITSKTEEETDRRKNAAGTESKKWFAKFIIKYGGVKHELSFEHTVKTDKNDKLKKGSLYYNEIHKLADDIRGVSETFKNIREGAKAAERFKNNIKKIPLVEGELKFEPHLKLEWQYATNEDNTQIGKQFDIILGAKLEGKMTIDILRSVITGAFPGFGSAVITAISYLQTAAEWIAKIAGDDDFEADIFFDLIITGGVTVDLDVAYNTVAVRHFSGSKTNAEVYFELEVKVGFKFKTSVFVSVEFKGAAGAKFGIRYNICFIYKEGDVYFVHRVKVDGVTLYLDASAAASYSKKSKGEKVTNSSGYKYKKEFKFGGKEFGPWEHNLTQNENKKLGKGNGGSSW